MTQNFIRALAALGAIAVLVLAAVALVAPQRLGGVNAYEAGVHRFGNGSQGGIQVGGSGSQLMQVIKGTCALIGADTSQAATSSAPYDCTVTGVQAGDLVVAQLATTTQNASNLKWSIEAAVASSTSGYITVRLSNGTGAAAKPSVTAVGSSTQFIVIR